MDHALPINGLCYPIVAMRLQQAVMGMVTPISQKRKVQLREALEPCQGLMAGCLQR